MNAEAYSMFALYLQTAVLTILLLLCIRMTGGRESAALRTFFAFGIASFLVSDLYWIAYSLLEPGTRMPFAVNEIGECACHLLLASAIRTQLSDQPTDWKRKTVAAAAFAAANTALWIAWSGEWLQDIISGLALGYYLTVAVRLLCQEDALSRTEWKGLSILSAALILMQLLTFLIPERIRVIPDGICYALMGVGLLFFTWKCIRAMRNESGSFMSAAFACMGCGTVCLYMSDGVSYTVISLFITAFLVMMFTAVKRRVKNQ